MRLAFKALALALVAVSCGTDGQHFRVDGRLRNLNQGELYIYSLENGASALDTVKIDRGKFSYETFCDKERVLMALFPNFSEQPIFASPGKTVELDGDASHLKELAVTGTEANELMNAFRKQAASMSPAQAAEYAGKMAGEHPGSPVAAYLVERYFMRSAKPDYGKAARLLKAVNKAQPRNGRVAMLMQAASALEKTGVGKSAPDFNAVATNGQRVGTGTLAAGKVGVVVAWASWNFESLSATRELQRIKEREGAALQVVGICVDGSRKDCREAIARDTMAWANICDEKMLQSPALKAAGIYSVPGNIVVKDGRIVAVNLSSVMLASTVEKLLK